MRKKMKEALVVLGSRYTTKIIDRELCIHRDLGNGLDIEVSGMNNNRRKNTRYKKYCAFVCVWDVVYTPVSVEYIWDIESLPALVRVLEELSAKYEKGVRVYEELAAKHEDEARFLEELGGEYGKYYLALDALSMKRRKEGRAFKELAAKHEREAREFRVLDERHRIEKAPPTRQDKEKPAPCKTGDKALS